MLNLNLKIRKRKQLKGFKNYFKSKNKIKKFNLLKRFNFNFIKYNYLNKSLKFLFNFKNFKLLKLNKSSKFLFNFNFKYKFLKLNSLKLQKYRLIYYYYYLTKKIKNLKFFTENSFFVKNYFQNKTLNKNKFFLFNTL